MTNKGNPVRSGRRVVILSAAKDPAFGLPFRTTAESKPRSFGRKNSPQDDKSPKLRSQDDKKRKNSPQDDKIPGHWPQDDRQQATALVWDDRQPNAKSRSFPSGDAPSASLGCCAIAIALLRTTKKQVLGRTEGCHPERSEGSRFRSAIPNNCRVRTEILRAKKQPSG